MRGPQLSVAVISAEHVGDLPYVPIVSRSPIEFDSPSSITILEAVSPDSTFWNENWRANLIDCLRMCAVDNHVGYVVPGHPMLGDATMQYLLSEDTAGRIDLEFYDEPLPIALTELLSVSRGSPAFIDALSILDLVRTSPFDAGQLPVSTNQTTVFSNIYASPVLRSISGALMRRYRPDTEVRLIPMMGTPQQLVLTLEEVAAQHVSGPHYLLLPAASGDEFQRSADDLQRLVARLRAPDGCPWDREQTNQSLGKNLIEESYELLEAIESSDIDAMREELGDFLLQALLHSQIAEEGGEFQLEDVIQVLIDKLVRRHPHVFATGVADTSDAVVQTWDEIKRAERAADSEDRKMTPALGNIPISLPALLRAQSVIKRSNRLNLPREEVTRFTDRASDRFESEQERQIAVAILKAVREAQSVGIDAEQVVRDWTRAYEETISEGADQDLQRR